MRKRELYEYDGDGNKVECDRSVCPACLKKAEVWDKALDICDDCSYDLRNGG